MKSISAQQKLFIYRLIAKGIDFFLVGVVHAYFDHVFTTLLALGYLLAADGFFKGQSLGKRIVGLDVTHVKNGQLLACPFRESAIRNAPFALIMLLSTLPILGILFQFFGAAFIAIEVYFMYTDEEGIRIGDIYAKTRVSDRP